MRGDESQEEGQGSRGSRVQARDVLLCACDLIKTNQPFPILIFLKIKTAAPQR